ncbi:MAG: hypothetical protein F7C08_02995 [Desulfurococcales archaeon]|nr:hypothetical protein [Desulfurococcales archaeon]MCE4605480.1 hypothetical protein [Desulfurococcales archaeon]
MKDKTIPVFLYSILRVHWGYIIRQPGATAAQAAYILPPPTTVIGAFANPLARILGVPDHIEGRRRAGLPVQNRYMECLIHATLAAGAGLVPQSTAIGVATYEEPSRIMGTPYKGGGAYQAAVKRPIYMSATELLPVQAAGAASAPGALIAIAWLADISKLSECLGYTVSRRDIEAAAWGVYRLGSREGIAHIHTAGAIGEGQLEVKTDEAYRSILYQDTSCVNISRGLASRIAMIGLNYKEREYLVPSGELIGTNILTPPSRPTTFYLRDPGCRAAGSKAEVNGVRLDLYLAYRR